MSNFIVIAIGIIALLALLFVIFNKKLNKGLRIGIAIISSVILIGVTLLIAATYLLISAID